MSEPKPVIVSADTYEEIQSRAAEEGLPAETLLRRWARNPPGSSRAARPTAVAPAPPATPQPLSMDSILETHMRTMMNAQLMRAMGGMGWQEGDPKARPVTREELADAIADAMRRGRPASEDEDDDPESRAFLKEVKRERNFRRIERMFSQNGEGVPNDIQRRIDEMRHEFDKRNEDLVKQNQELNTQLRTREEQDREDRRLGQLEQMKADILGRVGEVEARVTQLNAMPPGRDRASGASTLLDQIHEIRELTKVVDDLRGTGPGNNQAPWWVDRVERWVDKAGDNVAKMMEGKAAIDAAQRGLPPPGRMPGGEVPGTTNVYRPDYQDPRTAPPAAPAAGDPYPQLAGFEGLPGDPSTWPDIPYFEQMPGKPKEDLSRDEFVRRHGAEVYDQRKRMGVLPSQRAPPPAAAPPRPTASPAPPPAARAPSVVDSLSGGAPTAAPPPPGAAQPPPVGSAPSVFGALSGGGAPAPLSTPAPSETPPASTTPPPPPPAEGETPVPDDVPVRVSGDGEIEPIQ